MTDHGSRKDVAHRGDSPCDSRVQSGGADNAVRDKSLSLSGFEWRQLFFVLDSNDLNAPFVVSDNLLFGYCLVDGTIVDDADALGTRLPDGDGAYVLLTRRDGTITISQDFIGSFGLYLFREGDYFAVSNSFMALADHVRRDHHISINRRFCDYMLLADLCSASYSETPATEISLLDRRATLLIDIDARSLEISYVDYHENSVDIDTPEGIAVLDAWHCKWASLVNGLLSKTTNIQADLSGGFDTRLAFTALASSQRALDAISFKSINDGLHTHDEDFRIASMIADGLGFELNDQSGLSRAQRQLPLRDIVDISFFSKLGFHKQMYFELSRHLVRRYVITGSGGECVRSYWRMDVDAFIDSALEGCNGYSSEVAGRLSESTRQVLSRSFSEIEDRFEALGRPLADSEVTANAYRETRCRHHFGKARIESYCANVITLSPLLDKDLHRLRLSTKSCADPNLLAAVVLDRYRKELLDIPFEGGREIARVTKVEARRINDRFPFAGVTLDEAAIEDGRMQTAPVLPHDGVGDTPPLPHVSFKDCVQCLRDAFRSGRVERLFEQEQAREVYEGICLDSDMRKYHPLSQVYAALATCKALYDQRIEDDDQTYTDFLVSCAQDTRDARREGRARRSGALDAHLYPYATARIDISAMGPGMRFRCNAFGYHARVTRPQWMNRTGGGYTIEDCGGLMRIVLNSSQEGRVLVSLRGIFAACGGRNIPYWITYESLTISGLVALVSPQTVCHDRPYRLELSIAANEPVELVLSWRAAELATEVMQGMDPRLGGIFAETDALARAADLEQRIYDVEHSLSFRAGRALTWLPRKLRDHLRGEADGDELSASSN